jgi:hypothetical protein
MNQFYVINGRPKIGKDTFVSIVKEHLTESNYLVHNISTMEPLLKFIDDLGLNKEKTLKNRKMFSLLKEAVDIQGYTFSRTKEKICEICKENKNYNNIIFIHCREPKEIDKYVEFLHAKTILITSPEIEKLQIDYGNNSDNNVNNYNYDYIINNHKPIKIKNQQEINEIYKKTVEDFINYVVCK